MAGSARTHVLITLGVLFTVGGVSRMLPGTFASAENSSSHEAETSEAQPEILAASYTVPEPQKAASDEICFTGETAKALAEDQAILQARADELAEKEAALAEREQEVERKSNEVAVLRQSVDERWQTMATNANGDIEHLAQMYSAMKPDQAAQIFNQMDPGFAAGFLRLMPSDQAGLILAGMQAEKAYVVSVKLASKNGDIRAASPPQ